MDRPASQRIASPVAKTQSLRFRIIFLCCALTVGSCAAMSAIALSRAIANAETLVEDEVKTGAFFLRDHMQYVFDRIKNDAIILSKTPPVDDIVRSQRNGGGDPVDSSSYAILTSRLEKVFSSLLFARPDYFQARFIGVANNGMELVRVVRSGETSMTIGSGELQQKAGEPYFRMALSLAPGETQFSEVSLNREYGVIDASMTPTLRVLVPVYNEGAVFGFIVLNVNYEKFIQQVISRSNLPWRVKITELRSEFSYDGGGETPPYFRLLDANDSEAAHNSVTLDRIVRTDHAITYTTRLYIGDTRSNFIDITLQRDDRVIQDAVRDTLMKLLLMSVIVMLIACVLAYRFSVTLTTPLQKMTSTVQTSVLTASIPNFPKLKNDEIGVLADAFQLLAVSLEKSEALAKTVVENVVDAVVTFDADGTIVAYNKGAAWPLERMKRSRPGQRGAFSSMRNSLK